MNKKDRTGDRSNALRRSMGSGEKPIELGNSWYTAKTIEVERQTYYHSEGTALEYHRSLFCILNWKYRRTQ